MLGRPIAITLMASLGLSDGVSAADYAGASADQLTAAAVAAVNEMKAPELLSVMQEMQRRQMYFFEDDDEALCKRDAPKVGLLAERILDWGKARQAYFTYNQMQRLEEQSCDCPQKARSFEAFSLEFLGVLPEEITEAEIDRLQAFLEENENEVYGAYSDFYNSNCRPRP